MSPYFTTVVFILYLIIYKLYIIAHHLWYCVADGVMCENFGYS